VRAAVHHGPCHDDEAHGRRATRKGPCGIAFGLTMHPNRGGQYLTTHRQQCWSTASVPSQSPVTARGAARDRAIGGRAPPSAIARARYFRGAPATGQRPIPVARPMTSSAPPPPSRKRKPLPRAFVWWGPPPPPQPHGVMSATCRLLPRLARRFPTSARAVVLALAVATAIAAGGAPPVNGQGVPSFLAALPPLPAALLVATAPIYLGLQFEAPFEFRFNAAATAAEYDCLPVYAERDGYVPARGGKPPGRAAPRDRSEDAVVLCHVGAKVAIINHFFGNVGVGPLYAAAARLNVSLPRGCPSGSTCDDGCTMPPVTSQPACFGYHAVAKVTLDAIANDGFNADGRLGGAPYSDALTGYVAVNTPDVVKSLLRWVPLVENLRGFGTFVSQRFTMPQAGRVAPALVPARVLNALRAPPPYKSPKAYSPGFRCPAAGGKGRDPDGLCGLAAGVVKAVAGATERDLVFSHFFDQKSTSLAFFPFKLPNLPGFTYADYLVAEVVLNAVNHDATRVVWAEKRRHDAVRPVSLLRTILKGTRKGDTFASTLRTMPHPEYPSGSACICRAFGETLKAFGGEALPLTQVWQAGMYGPGVPSAPLTYTWPSIDALVASCSRSRLTAGLHFPPAVVEGERLCAPVAAAALKAFACRAPGTPGLPPCEA